MSQRSLTFEWYQHSMSQNTSSSHNSRNIVISWNKSNNPIDNYTEQMATTQGSSVKSENKKNFSEK